MKKSITHQQVLSLQKAGKINFIQGRKSVNPKIGNCYLTPSNGKHEWVLKITPNNNRNKSFTVGFLNL